MAENFSTKNLSSKVHKIYKQKFRANWMDVFSDWLIPCPDEPTKPFCKVCCRRFEGGITHIRRHANTPSHKRKCAKSLLHPACDGNLSPSRNRTSQKTVKVKCKGLNINMSDSVRENPSIEVSCQSNGVQTETVSNSFIETRSEDSQPLQIACVSVPHFASQHNGVGAEGQHESDPAAGIGLTPTIHQNSFHESNISVPSVVTSHVNAEFDNHISNNSHHLQPLHVHRSVQVSNIAQSKFTEHSEIFASNTSTQTKLQNETYLMELNDVGSSCEVAVDSNPSNCQGLANLEPEHHARHITVMIQGQDPMYIHSSVNPDSHFGYASREQTDACDSAPLDDSVEEPIVSMKTKRRKGKLKKFSKSKTDNRKESPCGRADRPETEALDSSHLDSSRSGGDDDPKDCKRNAKWYRQKYKKNWENNKEFCEWLSPAPADPSLAFCIACSKCLKGGVTHLKRHAETPYHKKRMVETMKKRQLICAKNVELRLSKFAHQFGLSDKAACALPELLRNIFPDNNLCKLLSDERILAMLMVHQESIGAPAGHAEKLGDYNFMGDQMKQSMASELDSSDCVEDKSMVLHSQSSRYAGLEPMPSEIITVGEHRASHESSVSYTPCTSFAQTTTAPHTIPTMNHGAGVPLDHGLPSFARCAGDTSSGRYSGPVETMVASRRPMTAVEASRGAVIVHHLDTDGAFKAYSHSVPYLPSSSMPLTVPGHERWQGRVAIVTNSSDGMGAAICRALVAVGMRVVGVAPSLFRIQELAKELSGERGSLTALQCDVSKDEEVERAFAEVLRTHGAVHCCVNNAGFSANASLLDGSPSEWRGMLDVNVVGLCLLTKLCVNSMIEKGIDDGHIIHVSRSLDSRVMTNPGLNLYGSTKHALGALTDCLRRELRSAESHISVSSISSGGTSWEDRGESGSGVGGVGPDHVAASVVHVLCGPPRVEVSLDMRSTQQSS